jgi:hypothetical protein
LPSPWPFLHPDCPVSLLCVQTSQVETPTASFSDKLSYYVENTLTASPYMQIVFLGIVVGIIIIVFGFIYNGGALPEGPPKTQANLEGR